MAKVILGGLLTSTFLNAFIVPIFYELLHRKEDQCHLEHPGCHPEDSGCHPEDSGCHPERSEGSETRKIEPIK